MNELTEATLEAWMEERPEWVVLPVSEKAYEWIITQARIRNANGAARGWKSKTDGSSLPFDIAGVAGEWACHHFFGIKYGRTVGSSRDELNGGDLTGKNIQIEVKSPRDNTENRWDLIENCEKLDRFTRNRERPYVNCLVTLLPKYVVIMGWAWGHEIAKGRRHRHGASGHEIYVLNSRQLRTPISLFDEAGIAKTAIANGI